MYEELKLLLISSFSGLISSLITYPIEVIKTKKQVNFQKVSNHLSGFQQSIYICMIQQGLKFSLYEYLGNYIKIPFINGLTTGAIQGFLISHFEIKKTLSQIYNQSPYKNYSSLTLRRYLFPIITCRDSLFCGTLFGIYKSDFLDTSDFQKKVSSAVSSAFITNPLDVFKSQVCASHNFNLSNLGLKDKFRFFFRGSLYRTTRMGSRYFIILTLNDKLKDIVK